MNSQSDQDKPLFSRESIGNAFVRIWASAQQRIEGIASDDILARRSDEVAAKLLAAFAFEVPVLRTAEVILTHDEIYENRRDVFGNIRRLPAFRYIYHVPFSGASAIFEWQPTTITPPLPVARIVAGVDSELQIEFRELTPNSDDIARKVERTIKEINSHLEWMKTDVDRNWKDLSVRVNDAIQTRRTRLHQAGLVAKSLGYPLRKRGDAERLAVPLKRKQIVATSAKNAVKPVAMDPFLEDAAYEEILNVLASMSLLVERNPSTFARIEEEVLRDHFLLQLNGQFEGRATGETFNAEGKTDILLRDGDRNVFIAECKFWKGPKSLSDAIVQLFGYLTWRDSKAAILLFNRNRNFSRVLGEAKNTLENHQQYRGVGATNRQTSFRASMARPDDNSRLIDLTVMLFDMPSADGT
jgi:hypothetical protein